MPDIGLGFNLVAMVYFFAKLSVFDDAPMLRNPDAAAVGRDLVLLLVAWVVIANVLASRWKGVREQDERDHEIAAMAAGWGRTALILCIVGIAIMLSFMPADRSPWGTASMVGNLLIFALMWGWLCEYVATLMQYRKDLAKPSAATAEIAPSASSTPKDPVMNESIVAAESSRFDSAARINVVAGTIAGALHIALLAYHGRDYQAVSVMPAMYLWFICWLFGLRWVFKKHGAYRASDADERELALSGRSGRMAAFCAYLTGCAMTCIAIAAAKFPESISPDIVAWSVFAMLLINCTMVGVFRIHYGSRS